MLTPQEVTSKEFAKARAVFGGYDAASVDEFLQQLAQDYSALYKENTILKNKLKVLVDKVEEYRSTEDAMRMALLSAQKTAREITENAQAESAKILAEAQAAADERKKELMEELAAEEEVLRKAKERTAAYLNMLKAASAEYNEAIGKIYCFAEIESDEAAAEEGAAPVISIVAPPQEKASKEDEIEETAKSIESSIAKILEQSISSDDAAEVGSLDKQSGKTADISPSKPKIDFNNLQFGSNYGKK